MGNLIWHDWAHFVGMTAAIYAIWAGYWGIFYRKFFWDFVNGTFRDPGGIQPANQDAFFIAIIVKAPVLQLISMIVGTFMLVIETGPGSLKKMALYRSLVVRAVGFFMLAFINLIYYQGINAGIYSLIACFGYVRAMMKGETMEEAKENRGKGGSA
jgi:hypothetical protein